MAALSPFRQRYWRPIVTVGIAGVLASSLLLLIFASTRANQTSLDASPAGREIALSSSPVVTLAVAADLGGPFGWPEANAVQLAISQTNAAGGINAGGITYTLALTVANSPCNAGATAATVATTLSNTANVIAVVGHTCSGEMIPALPIYQSANLALISPSATRPGLVSPYNVAFRTISHDGAPLILLATYFRNQLGLSRTAIVEGPFINTLVDFYEDTFLSLGGTVVTRTLITDPSNFTSTLTAIQALNPDVIANLYYDTPVGPDPVKLGQLSRIAYNLGMTNVIIGWNTFSNDESAFAPYANAAGAAAAENDYGAFPLRRTQDMPGWAAFLAAYQAANFPNAQGDPGVFGAFAYDAARIIIAAIDRANNTGRVAVRNEISATSNYVGVVGRYEGFDTSGDVIPQWAWLAGYRNGGWVILVPNHVSLPVVLKNP